MLIKILQKLDQYDSLDVSILTAFLFFEFFVLTGIFIVFHRFFVNRIKRKHSRDVKEVLLGEMPTNQTQVNQRKFNSLNKKNW